MNESVSTEIENKPAKTKKNRSILFAVLAAIGASACCVGPLVLLTLGISGAWIGYLTAMEDYRLYFMGITALFLFLAFRQLYLKPQVCEPGKSCADPNVIRNQRIIFWVVSVLLVILMAFPWYAPLFY